MYLVSGSPCVVVGVQYWNEGLGAVGSMLGVDCNSPVGGWLAGCRLLVFVPACWVI